MASFFVTINGSDVNQPGVENLAFDNETGNLTVEFTAKDNYVCLGENVNKKWYMTDAYVDDDNEAILKCQVGNKLYVPKGKWTFTMTYQTDGSIKLTYNPYN